MNRKQFEIKGTEQFTCETTNDGSILLIPSTSVPVNQRYFWSKRWQKGEREAAEDIRAGRYKDHHSVKDLISELNSRRRKK